MGGAAFRPRGWYFATPRNGICGLPLTMAGTLRPAAFWASSMRSVIVFLVLC
jgi:hypothetical protein